VDNENNFVTTDIYLATFLRFKGIRLIQVMAIDTEQRLCSFVFENVPKELLAEWLAGSTVKNIINQYRHTIRDAREACEVR
jgi:hypothetical protein